MVLSLGARTPVYGWLYHVFPPMQGLRAAARFGNLFLLGMAVLEGVRSGRAASRRARERAARSASGSIALANIESLRAPLLYTRFDGIPAIYSLLAARARTRRPRRGAVLSCARGVRERRYVLSVDCALAAADERLQRLHARARIATMRRRSGTSLQRHAIQEMRKAGVTHVMVHPDRFGTEVEIAKMWQEVAASPYLERIASTPNGPTLYRLK